MPGFSHNNNDKINENTQKRLFIDNNNEFQTDSNENSAKNVYNTIKNKNIKNIELKEM